MDWSAQPELWLFKEVIALTRHSAAHAYDLLERGKFPIACVPGVRPYRFPKANIKAWVEGGTVTNTALRLAKPRRQFFKRATA
jgi:predicted DNA-binding transcriptional regulator AlpA